MQDTDSSPKGIDGASSFELHYHLPDPDLAEMVSSFYFARIDSPSFDEYERADRPQFRMMTQADGEYIFSDGFRIAATRAMIIGPTSGRVRAICNGPTSVVGFGMMPVGWASLMGNVAEKLTDRAIDACNLFGGWIDKAVATLATASDREQQLVIANNLAREILKANERAPAWFTRTVDQWLTSSSAPQVPELVDATGMSIRSVERMTKRFYGVSPSMLARKYRAVRATSALARGASGEISQMGDAFYDQSHLIREVKRFAGATPSQLSKPSLYTVATTKGRKDLAGKVSPLISDT